MRTGASLNRAGSSDSLLWYQLLVRVTSRWSYMIIFICFVGTLVCHTKVPTKKTKTVVRDVEVTLTINKTKPHITNQPAMALFLVNAGVYREVYDNNHVRCKNTWFQQMAWPIKQWPYTYSFVVSVQVAKQASFSDRAILIYQVLNQYLFCLNSHTRPTNHLLHRIITMKYITP